VQPGSASVGWATELTAGVHLTERDERERDQLERRHRHTGRMGQRGGLRPMGEVRPVRRAGPKAKWAGKACRAESEK
jgi:hypothetical protein